MGELAVIPIRLSQGQAALVGVVMAGLLLALVATGLLEAALAGGAGLLLRLAGRRSPPKSAVEMALEDIETRLRRRERPAPDEDE